MQVAVRSYLAAGIATVGASAIVLSPVSPVVPRDMPLPPVEVSIPVELAAAVNPIQAYLDLVNNTVKNLSSVGQTILQDPAPILRQILTNQFSSAGELLSALQQAGGQLLDNVSTIVPQQLQEALANLAAGNIVGVGQNVVNIITQPVLFPALTLLPAIQTFLEQPVANLLAVTQQFTTIAALGGIGLLEPLVSTVNATAQAIQNIVDAAKGLDPVGAVSAIVAVPAIVANGLLNGFGFDGGVLSPGLGLAGALLQIRDVIANALKPVTVTTSTSLAAANSTTTSAATTVTLSTTPATTAPKKSAEATTPPGADANNGATSSGTADSTTGKDASTTPADPAGAEADATGGKADATGGKADASAPKDTAASSGDAKTEAGSSADKGDASSKDTTSKSDTSATKADSGDKKTDGKKDADGKKDTNSAKAGSE
ncbi:hypothetical protein [Mycobacterium sp. OAE908]|uniref:hypothetical protein n=1 Tax=Mycobacterium sp. OAE908 TaxID=2817899 RepID=UPI001AE1D561